MPTVQAAWITSWAKPGGDGEPPHEGEPNASGPQGAADFGVRERPARWGLAPSYPSSGRQGVAHRSRAEMEASHQHPALGSELIPGVSVHRASFAGEEA